MTHSNFLLWRKIYKKVNSFLFFINSLLSLCTGPVLGIQDSTYSDRIWDGQEGGQDKLGPKFTINQQFLFSIVITKYLKSWHKC